MLIDMRMSKAQIILENNYVYDGDVYENEPHGEGIMRFENGDLYVGHFRHGYMDGYGLYYFNVNEKLQDQSETRHYEGYFSHGRFHGLGTYYTASHVYKGGWYNGKKHGIFIHTDRLEYHTYKECWKNGKFIDREDFRYIDANCFHTYKINPKNKAIRKANKNTTDKCVICCESKPDAVNYCGHRVACYSCLTQCKTCPICRAPIHVVIKIYLG